MKRVLSVVLTLMILLSLIPGSVFAAEPFTRADAAVFLAESFAMADIHALRKKPFPQQVVRCERKPAKAES